MTDTEQKVPFSATEPYRFCPADGTSLEAPKRSGGARCPLCGRSWYRNSTPAVGTAIVRDGRALITVRAREPEKGRLDLPGGFLEVGEHPVTGLVREVKEELGVEIEVAGNPILLATYTYGADGEYGLAIGFEARIVAGEPQPADDVAEVRWVSAEELDDLDFAWSHDRELVRAALAGGSV
ncbi:MAG TPA: NUDIX domain-containing protein [Rubrobacteraceae bacterium]|nr:NUDIX domain-containing protein [Rubrobacteraceae bacterium]